MKIVAKGVGKIEQLLKVVLRPHDPPGAIVETYNLLYGDHDVANFTKILELKGLRHRHEMASILDAFQAAIPKDYVPPTQPVPQAPQAPALNKGLFKPWNLK
jgi:hypothetical protein